MSILYPCELSVTAHAEAGKQIAVPDVTCAHCGRALIGWGGYWRTVRHLLNVFSIWVPRRRCLPCRTTEGLLPEFVLERRLDTVEVIGQAISARLQGAKIKTVAIGAGHARHHRARLVATSSRDGAKPPLERGLMAWTATHGDLPWLGWPDDVDSAEAAALGAAWHAGSRRGWRLARPWRFWSLITGGVALATNTSPLFPRVPVARDRAAATVRPPP